MKKQYVLSILVSGLFSGSVLAQSPSVNSHEKKVVIKDGKTYVQKSLPLYLSFSTSPNGKNTN